MCNEASYKKSVLPAVRRLSRRFTRHILATALRRFLAACKECQSGWRDTERMRSMTDYQLRDMGMTRLADGSFAPLSGYRSLNNQH